MCTILSAFTTPSWAGCNLFDINSIQIVSTGYDYTINNNSFVVTAKSGTSDASRISFYIDAKKFKENTKYYFYSKSDKAFSQERLNIGKATLDSTTNHNAYGTLHSKIDNGYAGVFEITTIAPDQEYVSFFYYLGEQPEGTQITISDIMITEGSTATPYVPYDPLCATCDGTIVNYTSATGTGVQNGTPTPTNPIEPTFYKQGNMVLRKVGDYADSYDATTGKITRRVGVKVFDGTEDWGEINNNRGYFIRGGVIEANYTNVSGICTHYKFNVWHDNTQSMPVNTFGFNKNGSSGLTNGNITFRPDLAIYDTVEKWQQFLATQAAAGTPVTMWYPLAEETTEDWTESSYCYSPIKIATTKYNETKFSPLNTALANAISVVDTVVSNTITQAASIATLQAQKQTRPANDTCPAYKQCLLVEDEQGVPHWYEITDPFRDFVAPIIANNVAPASTTNSAGYTQLEYIESTGTQYIDTGVRVELGKVEIKYTMLPNDGDWATIIGKHGDNIIFRRKTATSDYEIYMYSSLPYTWLGGYVENQTRTLQVSRSGNNIIIYSNGQLVFEGQNDKKEGGEDNSSIYLFSSTLSGKSVYPSKSRLYYAKFYTKDGTLVRNFVPVRNNATGKYGLYDTVGGQFYGNANTSGDDFTPGPEVLNQDPDVPGMTWTATWAANATTGVTAGTITGEGLCNGVSGTAKAPATSAQMSSANWSVDGASCWCRATGVDDGNDTTTVDGVWVFDYTYGSTGICPGDCARDCTARINDTALFRKAVLGM